MNGHQPLLALRRSGYVTPAVFVTDGAAVELELDRKWPDPVFGSEFAHVRIEAADIPEAIDLRFAVGMLVVIDCQRSEERAQRLHNAFVAANPRAVATHSKNNFWIHHRG